MASSSLNDEKKYNAINFFSAIERSKAICYPVGNNEQISFPQIQTALWEM